MVQASDEIHFDPYDRSLDAVRIACGSGREAGCLRIRRTAPRKGEHSREILEQIDYPASEIDALVEAGAVGEG